jgi:membrane fusion protein, multidrug efflux system
MITKVLPEPETRTESVTKPEPVKAAPPAVNLPWERARAKPKSRWAGLVWWAVWIAAGAVAYYTVPWEAVRVKVADFWKSKTTTTVVKPPRGPIPVLTSVARQGNMEMFLNGLGSVTALYTVTIKSRVDGELTKINFTEGQMVREGDLLAEIDTRPFYVMLHQAEGNLIRDKAALKIAQLDLDRYNALIGPKAITQQQLDQQVALVRQSEGAIKTDLAQIDNAKLQLVYCHITAPISGRIGLRIVDPGNMVHAGDPSGLAVITQLQPITVVFTIPQDDIARVQKRINTGEELEVDAYDREFKMKLATGKLWAIDNQVDSTTGTVRIKAVFENKDNMLFPNQFVNARLLVDTRHDAVIVASAAVQRGPDSTFVYVVTAESKVDLRNVVMGPSEGDQTIVESGLAAGETVVIDGVDKLQPGMQVAARERGAKGGAAAARAVDAAPRAADAAEPKGQQAAAVTDGAGTQGPRKPQGADGMQGAEPSAAKRRHEVQEAR